MNIDVFKILIQIRKVGYDTYGSRYKNIKHKNPRRYSLDLDQTSMAHMHTERHKSNAIKFTFRLQISIWMIVMMFVTHNGT